MTIQTHTTGSLSTWKPWIKFQPTMRKWRPLWAVVSAEVTAVVKKVVGTHYFLAIFGPIGAHFSPQPLRQPHGMTVSHIVKVNHTVVERGLEYCWAPKCWRLKCSNYKYLVLYPQILLFPSMTERQPHSSAAHSRGKSPLTLARWPASTLVLHGGLQRDIQGAISIQLCCEGTDESLRKKRYFQSFGFIYFSSATFKRLNAEKIKHYDYLFDNSCKV